MNWAELLVQALDEAHDSHGSDECGCDCYDRLRAMVVKGLYWFPLVPHDVMEPPAEGPETLHQYMVRGIYEKIDEDFYRVTKILTEKFSGFLPRAP